VTDPGEIDRARESEFEAELTLQRGAELMLMFRGIAILVAVTALVVLRSLLL
jgi:hypothetical protein